MTASHYASLLDAVKIIAMDAGEKIMAIYSTDFDVDTKDDQSPLTEADLAAHHHIVAELAKIASFPIISEESSDISFAKRKQWETYWLVDPLDGTKEFVKRNGDFTVNIALIHQHKAVLGVVYVPVTKQSFYAAEGVGAFKETIGDAPEKISVRKQMPEKLVVAGSRSHVTEDLKKYLDKLPAHKLISIGSSLKFCLVADGTADLYPRIGLTSEWDTGAAQCVVEQAGGLVTDLQGNKLQYNTKESFLNPFFLVFGNTEHDWTQYV